MSLKGAMDPIWCIDGISVWKYGIFTWIKQIIVKVINNFEINFFICDNLPCIIYFYFVTVRLCITRDRIVYKFLDNSVPCLERGNILK